MSLSRLRLSEDVRIRILLAFACCLVALGLRFLWVSPELALFLVRKSGYYVTALLVGLWIYWAWKARPTRPSIAFLRKHLPGLLLVVIATVLTHLHETHRFKVVYDEYNIATEAQNMHRDREIYLPSQAHYLGQNYEIRGHTVDKRVPLFAFLTSLLHDLTGYRSSNAFIVNGAVSLLYYLAAYTLLTLIWNRWGGYMAVILAWSLPLVHQVATSGSYDLLNALLLLNLLIGAGAYLRQPSDVRQNFLVFSGLLMAYTRYESILYVLALSAIILESWIQQKQIRLTWATVLSPLFLILPLLLNLHTLNNDVFFENKEGTYFGFHFLEESIPGAQVYLLDPSLGNTNSLVLSVLGMLGLVSMLLMGLKRPHQALANNYQRAVYLCLPIVGINTLILLATFWSNWIDPATTRFSLPLQTILIIAAVSFIFFISQKERFIRAALAILAITSLLFAIPKATKHEQSDLLAIGQAYEFALSQVSGPKENTFFIGPAVTPFIVEEYPAIEITLANVQPTVVKALLDLNIYPNIYVLRLFNINKNLDWIPREHSELNPEFITEEGPTVHLAIHVMARLDRLVDVDVSGLDMDSIRNRDTPLFKNEKDLHEYLFNAYPWGLKKQAEIIALPAQAKAPLEIAPMSEAAETIVTE